MSKKSDIRDILIGIQSAIEVTALVQCMIKGESNLVPHSTMYAVKTRQNKDKLTQKEIERGESFRSTYQDFMG